MKIDWKRDPKRVLAILIASLLMAISIKTFVRAADLFPGGVTGLTVLTQRLCEKYLGFIPDYTPINLALNAFPVYVGFRYVGKKFTLLILRREEFPDNGDLLMIAVCLWAVIRLGTEDFRLEPHILFHFTSSVTVLLCLIIWTVRRARICRMPLRTAAEMTAVTACLVLNILTTMGVLSAGSEIADFAVEIGSALLAMILTLITGSDVRRMNQKEVQPS